MKIRHVALICFVLSFLVGIFSFRAGWEGHKNKAIAEAAEQQKKAEKEIQPIEQKAAKETAEAKVIYRTITRDVVKYVQSPNRTVCRLDDDAIRLRQQAIDAANSITGFDATPMQGK